MAYELTFKLPYTELHPYYKKLIQYMRRHNYCIMDFEALLDETFNNPHQLEAFRCAVREISNERDREVIIDDDTMSPHIIIELAERGMPGSIPDQWEDEDDQSTVLKPASKPKLII